MQQAIEAKHAATQLLAITEQERNLALRAIADELLKRQEDILQNNSIDIEAAKAAGLSSAMVDRLLLTPERVNQMVAGVMAIADQEQVVGIIEHSLERDDGLLINTQRVPIGVLAMIFESRPNVVIDCSALAIKSGNAIILKGGKEAARSNRILFECIQTAIDGILPKESIQLAESRADVAELLQQKDYVDLIIPRGGEGLVAYVESESMVPVLAHHKGLCHMYVDASADLGQATDIILNAKAQRPGVCNALETLLLDDSIPMDTMASILESVKAAGVELRLSEGCPDISDTKAATDEDWDTEYLDLILSVKTVSDVNEACEHIKRHGTQHTEVVLAQDSDVIEYFQNHVDASALMVNASSRFNDGGEFQLGAELGISTTKLHSYGPMGAKEMTICRHLVVGENHIRGG